MSKRLADCQRVIGYHFANPSLLEVALTHSSVRTPDRECNERLEFLGDSVLGLTMTEELYKRLPDQQEGELTRIKSAVVSRGALYRVSTRLGLTRFVEIAKGVGKRDELPVSLTANLVESIIGAIYLDAGFFPAREFVLRHLGPELEDVMNDRVAKNYKSLLQHECQQVLGATPTYRTLEEEGPDHRKSFTVACVVRGTEYGRATGINKKEAEQEAARHALETLQRRGRGGRRRRGGRVDPTRDREEARSLVRQTSDEDSWRQWAEGPAGAPAAGGGAPASGPPVVGPEADEAYDEAPSSVGAPGSSVPMAPDVESRPLTPELRESEAAPHAPAGGDDGDSVDGEPRRRRGRRGRRGGRGRSRRGELPETVDAPADGGSLADGGAPAPRTPEGAHEAPSIPAAPSEAGPIDVPEPTREPVVSEAGVVGGPPRERRPRSRS